MSGFGGGNDVVTGRYALVDPIASGGSGTVWRAYDHEREQWCAAKVMRQRHAGEVLRFAREQSVRLHHPHATGEGPLHCMLTDVGLTIGTNELRLTQTGMVIGPPATSRRR